MAISCVEGRCIFTCPPIVDAASDDALVANGGASGNAGSGGVAGANTGSGGFVGAGGAVGSGRTPGSGGTSRAGGSAGGSSVYGMPCTTNEDCPLDAVCCDGSDEGCDGTRLPAGDGTNSGELVVSADGLTVTDTITGLVWQRDGSGTRSGCASGTTCTWAEAKAYCASLTLGGASGWRLPGVMELVTIVDATAVEPAIDPTAFPSTPADFFWTCSPLARFSGDGDVWNVHFGDGSSTVTVPGDYDCRVRCVRGSRCFPTSRFVVLDGGLVSDALTNLVWQQQASAATMTWAQAQTYCSAAGAGFRLPMVKELRSIVDYTVAAEGPAIDRTAFPNTPADWFWASSPSAWVTGQVWYVQFSGGTSGSNGGGPFWVRCVR